MIVLLAALVQACGGKTESADSDATSTLRVTRIILSASPQADHVLLAWSTVPSAGYYLPQWKAADEQDWRVGSATTSTSLAAPLPTSGRGSYRVLAMRGTEEVGRSEIVVAEMRDRSDCTYLSYIPWEPSTSFFCSWAALNEHLKALGVGPERLRCRGRPVGTWNLSSPDCYYTVDDHRLLLLRGAGDSFVAPPIVHPSVVRAVARATIWAGGDPFSRGETVPLQPVGKADPASVRGAASVINWLVPESVLPGVRSRVTMLVPHSPKPGRYAIYHEGHGGASLQIGAETIQWLLDRGWVVFAMDMPLIGRNAVDADPLRRLTTHNDLIMFDDGSTSPLAAFLLPVKAVVDHIYATKQDGSPPVVVMIGRSGGGWTTYTYAALDPRIDVAVSVAGGRPLSQRLDAPWGPLELGDYEQTDPTLYSRVGHEYLMTTAGRLGALLMFASNDPCCFQVRQGDPFVAFVESAARANGTAHRVYIDEEHRDHGIGPAGYRALEDYLSSTLGGPSVGGRP